MTLYHAVMCLVEYAIIINDNDIVKIKLFIRHKIWQGCIFCKGNKYHDSTWLMNRNHMMDSYFRSKKI